MKRTLLLAVLGLAATSPALADLALATSKNCMSCHAAKYKDNKGAADMLATKIVKGGSGVWGAVPMPANNQVSEAEAKKLAAWVLSTK
jgi:cytochrome c